MYVDLIEKAQVLKQDGQVDDAIEVLQQAIAQAPEKTDAYRQLGDILFNEQTFDEAAKNYQKVVELAPEMPYPYFRLGQIYKTWQQWANAVDSCQKAIALNPKNSRFYKELGDAYLAQEALDEAEIAFQMAIELKPDLQDAYFRLGIIQQKQERLDEAIASFESLLDLNSNHFGGHQRLGDSYVQKKEFGLAIAHYQKAISIKDDNPFLYAKLARVLQNDDQFEPAINAWRSAIQLKADRYGFHEQLGDLRLQQDEIQEAIASYEKAIALKPDLPSLNKKMNTALQKQTMSSVSAEVSASGELISTEMEHAETLALWVSPQVSETVAEPLPDEVTQLGSQRSDEKDSDIGLLVEEVTSSTRTIENPKTSQDVSQKLIQDQRQEDQCQEEEACESTLSTNDSEAGETLEAELLMKSSRTTEDHRAGIQEMPITVKLDQTVRQGKGSGASGKTDFSKYKRRSERSTAVDNTGFQKNFKFSAESVGGYDESIPPPAKKTLVFVLLGFYGAIALGLFLKGLTTLSIFMVAIACVILLVFWGFNQLK